MQNIDRMADKFNTPPDGDEHDEECAKYSDADADCECWELVKEIEEDRAYERRNGK